MEDIVKKLKVLNVNKLQLLGDIQSNNLVGEMLVALLREFGTEAEVEKVLLHISQVEFVTHLLVVLTRRLARIEKEKESMDRIIENVSIIL